MHVRIVGGAFLALAASFSVRNAFAQQPPPSPDEAGGEMRITALKPAEPAQPLAGADKHAPNMDAFADASNNMVAIGATKARFSLNFFGDVNAMATSAVGTHPSFSLGAQDFLVTGRLDEHFVATSEFAIEFGENNEPGVDLERLHVGYYGEHFFVRAGRVHTELGYWNNAYHHGKWLSPSIDRPRWVAFEDDGGLLPIHTIGVGGGAIADIADGKLKWTVSIANGRGRIVDDIRNKYDYQLGKMFHSQVEYIASSDWRFGVSALYDTIPARGADVRPALPDTDIREYIVGAHVAYPSYPAIGIAEGYLIEHRVPGRSFTTFGGFVLVGYAFNPITPYLRVQAIVARGGDDPFFNPDPANAERLDILEGVAGVRVDLTSWTAVRAEYRATETGTATPIHAGIAQWCWAF